LGIIYQIYRMSVQLKPWGIIYESRTGNPIAMAVVKIIDPEYNRVLETKMTDFNGRFSFLVVPGKYIITVEKDGYHFPTKAFQFNKDKKHLDWYCGQKFVIKPEHQSLINIDIPIDNKI
ncbi:MAG TPA: carboxypeptidase-like regulatory domain-containing protein, partial [bacterium]|nr:carboxypeptidase-like regulatory domain-containing protein [bacterium]